LSFKVKRVFIKRDGDGDGAIEANRAAPTSVHYHP